MKNGLLFKIWNLESLVEAMRQTPWVMVAAPLYPSSLGSYGWVDPERVNQALPAIRQGCHNEDILLAPEGMVDAILTQRGVLRITRIDVQEMLLQDKRDDFAAMTLPEAEESDEDNEDGDFSDEE